MEGRPSAAAWVALAVLSVLYLAAASRERTREPASRPGKAVLPNWTISVTAALAACPAAAALIQSAPVSTVVWWLLLGPVATGLLLAVVGTATAIAMRWPRWRRELTPDEHAIVYLVIVLSLASALALPAVSSAVLVLDGDVPLAAALALAAAYALWRAALEVTRRSQHFA
jgi:hypothetical protein